MKHQDPMVVGPSDGNVRGDDRPLPNRGTGTGLTGDTYGASIDQSAINRRGGISGTCGSDAPFNNTPPGER